MKQYAKIEFEADNASFISPSGRKYEVNGFDYQPIEFSYDIHGFEDVFPCGKPRKTVRFFPNEAGEWRVLANGKEESLLIEEAKGGFVKISADNPKYFSLSDGTPWFAIGINLAFISPFSKCSSFEFGQSGIAWLGMKQYERWFKRCAENGVNMARIWLGHEYFCPDTAQADELDLIQLSKIDALLDLAEKYGIRLKLTLENFRSFDYDRVADGCSYDDDIFRKFNKKLWLGDKRCESRDEWLQERPWRDAWKRKVAKLAQRLKYNPNIFGIELWNEMNCLGMTYLDSWNKEMLPAVKELFPNHLVMNSIGSFESDTVKKDCYDAFCWELSDIKQMHRYLDLGAPYEICHNEPLELVRDGINILSEDTKPFMVAETGAVNDCHSGPFPLYMYDDNGLLFCDFVYTPVFCGSAGSGNMWHWDSRYIEAKNLYRYFAPISRLIDGIDFAKEAFEFEEYKDSNVTLLTAKGKSVTIGYLRNNAYSWQNILRDNITPNTVDFTFPIEGEIEIIPIDDTPNICDKTVIGLKYGILFKTK